MINLSINIDSKKCLTQVVVSDITNYIGQLGLYPGYDYHNYGYYFFKIHKSDNSIDWISNVYTPQVGNGQTMFSNASFSFIGDGLYKLCMFAFPLASNSIMYLKGSAVFDLITGNIYISRTDAYFNHNNINNWHKVDEVTDLLLFSASNPYYDELSNHMTCNSKLIFCSTERGVVLDKLIQKVLCELDFCDLIELCKSQNFKDLIIYNSIRNLISRPDFDSTATHEEKIQLSNQLRLISCCCK